MFIDHFSSHFFTPNSLLDILLTGTFQQVKAAVISANIQNKQSQLEPSVKREIQNSTDYSSLEKTEASSKKLKKETVFWKSRGRWNISPEMSRSEVRGDLNKKRSLKTEVIWKVDLKKCIDSSPLLVLVGGEELVVSCSHSGLVASLRLR